MFLINKVDESIGVKTDNDIIILDSDFKIKDKVIFVEENWEELSKEENILLMFYAYKDFLQPQLIKDYFIEKGKWNVSS